MNSNIKFKDKVYAPFESRFFKGYRPVAIEEVEPWAEWRGAKMALEQWDQVKSFMRWGFEKSGGEVQLRLLYNPETQRWCPWAFPQEESSTLFTKELPEASSWAYEWSRFPAPWLTMGSVHQHARASAFQSGTDHSDEKTSVGLHVTLGHMDKAIHDLHARVFVLAPGVESQNGGPPVERASSAFYDACLSEWFELPPGAEQLDPETHQGILKHYLTRRSEVPFPDEWKANLIEKPPLLVSVNKVHQHPAHPSYADWEPQEAAMHKYLQNFADGPEDEPEAGEEFPLDPKSYWDIEEAIYGELRGMRLTSDDLIRMMAENKVPPFYDKAAGEVQKMLDAHGVSAAQFQQAGDVFEGGGYP